MQIVEDHQEPRLYPKSCGKSLGCYGRSVIISFQGPLAYWYTTAHSSLGILFLIKHRCCCVSICIWVWVLMEAKRVWWIPWNWTYKRLRATWWVLGTELKSLAKATSTLNCWAVFPSFRIFFFYFPAGNVLYDRKLKVINEKTILPLFFSLKWSTNIIHFISICPELYLPRKQIYAYIYMNIRFIYRYSNCIVKNKKCIFTQPSAPSFF